MLIGCCASMIAPQTDPIGIECIEPLAELGYDYIELSLSHLTALTEVEFSAVIVRLQEVGLPCRTCNNFFPSTCPLTGLAANLKSNLEYAKHAMHRAAKIGANTIVFGSSGAKNVPYGFPLDLAWSQVVELLQHLGPLAAHYNLLIVIEPISRPESNLVLTAAEGLQLMHAVDHPHVRLLIDYYHLTTEHEDVSIVATADKAIRHLHLATIGERRFPPTIDTGIASFLRHLQAIDYGLAISIEAFTDNFRQDAALSLRCLRSWFAAHPKPGHLRDES
jgi:D-psicose/D-tagatose/L-ribulose 3-epimerase